MKGAWWWSEEVKEKVKRKQEKYKALVSSRMDEEEEVNKVVAVKDNDYERLYQILDSKEGEKDLQASKGQGKTNKRYKYCKVY